MEFDRLFYIDRLKEAGVGEPIARAHADALRHALQDTVATKADLKEAVQQNKADLREVVQQNKADLKEAVQMLRTEIAALDRKIEITSSDLIIKGAGGLIIIASLMVGLKLLG